MDNSEFPEAGAQKPSCKSGSSPSIGALNNRKPRRRRTKSGEGNRKAELNPASGLDVGQINSDVAGASIASPNLIEDEIRNLARNFGYNDRVAREYRANRDKITAFLNLLREHAPKVVDEEDPDALEKDLIIEKSVDDMAKKCGASAHEVDKWLRWADRTLKILHCRIPEQKKDRLRVIKIKTRSAWDLGLLLDPGKRVGFWDKPVEVTRNGFKFKSLCAFALNIAIGCLFGCWFCYVPSVSTINLGWRLIRFGILDADAEWGSYALIRRWDDELFRNSLRDALAVPEAELPADGHRAIMMSTDTDPYMPIFHPEPKVRKELHQYLRTMVRRILVIMLEPEFDGLKLRIQTRGLEVEQDFDLLEKFGDRLLLGMSIPTLNNKQAKIYEPKAPAPTRRLALLSRAKARGIHVYVAMAPTYPECDDADLRKTLEAFAALRPWTIFHEPINMRARNIDRIEAEAERQSMTTTAGIIRSKETRTQYAINQLRSVEKIGEDLGISDILHLWPDPELDGETVVDAQPDPAEFRKWINHLHSRRSEWPGDTGPRHYTLPAKPQKVQNDLSSVERKTLDKAVSMVKKLGACQRDAGRALRLIRDAKLHRPLSFDEFCRERFGFSRQYGYRLIDLTDLAENLSTVVDNSLFPLCEKQARPIMKAFRNDPGLQRKAWVQACELAGNRLPEADSVKAVVEELLGRSPRTQDADKEPALAQHQTGDKVFEVLGEMEMALGAAAETETIQKLLSSLREEIAKLLPDPC